MSSTSVKTGAEVIQTPKTQSIGTEKIATAAKSNSKDEEICDDWEQLDQQVGINLIFFKILISPY